MSQIETWLPTVVSKELRSIPSWAANQGAKRLEAAAALLGAEESKKIARKAGAYELTDALAQELRLQGVEISARGEVPALSPANWLCSSALHPLPLAAWRERWESEGVRLEGIVLSSARRKAFLSFLSAVSCTEVKDVWALLEIADHFFQADNFELVVSRRF